MRWIMIAVGVVLLAALAFVAGTRYAPTSLGLETEKEGRRVLYYACPMHPQYRSDEPGDCLSCGMRLEPVYEDDAGAAESGASVTSGSGIKVSAERQQLLGLHISEAGKASGSRNLRTNGRVAADENRLYRLNASTELWIRKVYDPVTGSLVRKDEPLLEYYAANFLSAASSYMYALNARDRQAAAGQTEPSQLEVVNFQIRQAVESLQNLGVSDTDIAEMEKSRKVRDLVTLRSPVDGFVLSRTATMGEWIAPSTELYRIADLSQVWIYADVFENEASGIRPGMTVRVSAPNKGITFTAKVSDVPPVFDEATRITKVRLDAENPGLRLWPGMFVEVEFPLNLSASIAVPVDAVIDSGLRKTVYVAKGDGYFEPRQVETGWRMGGQVEITKGLMEGEQIVVSGNFLLDSESRMRMTAGQDDHEMAERGGLVVDPVCGMDVSPDESAGKSEYKGKTYYFCSDQCKKKFDQNPEAVLSKRKG